MSSFLVICLHCRPRSKYQYYIMVPRLSGQISIFGFVFFVFKSRLGIKRQTKLKKVAILTRKPRKHVRILIYRTWLISEYRASKIRCYLTLQQLKQIYYNLIYPYISYSRWMISYSILAWSSVYKTHKKKIQVKQNHIVRLSFYARTFGREAESAKPLLSITRHSDSR